MKCHACGIDGINERPYCDAQTKCFNCGACSGIVPFSVATPKRGEVYRWADSYFPIVISGVEGENIWVFNGSKATQNIRLHDWKHNFAHGAILPF